MYAVQCFSMKDSADIGLGRFQTPVPKGLHVGSINKGFKCSTSWFVYIPSLVLCQGLTLPFRCDHWAVVCWVGVRPRWTEGCAYLHYTNHRPRCYPWHCRTWCSRKC